jgi:hypothetical protein
MSEAVIKKAGVQTEEKGKGLGFFERYLTIWVALCIAGGVALGQLLARYTAYAFAVYLCPGEYPGRDPDLVHDLPDDGAD